MVEDKYLSILMEEMNSKFELVLEGHQVLRHDIRRMEETLSKKIGENTTRIKINSDLIKTNSDSIKALDEKLSTRIDAVGEKLTKRIDVVDKNLTKRINEEGESLGVRIDAVAVDLKAHRADTEMHYGIYRVQESTT